MTAELFYTPVKDSVSSIVNGHRGIEVIWDPAILFKINSNFVS